jgi:hypothetical protein
MTRHVKLDPIMTASPVKAFYAPSGTSPGRSGPSGSSADVPR